MGAGASREYSYPKALSKDIFHAMDHLGYSPEIIEHRRRVYKQTDELESVTDMYQDHVSVGSMSEGFSAVYESSHDVLLVDKHVVCKDDTDNTKFSKTETVLKILNKSCHPGHFMLKMENIGTLKYKQIKRSLVKSKKGLSMLSSELYVKAVGTQEFRRSTKDRYVVYRTDKSQLSAELKPRTFWSFRCTCARKLLAEWSSRKRKHGWPSAELIEEVLAMEAQVIPVDCSNRGKHWLEWRACFITGEIRLSETWSEVQYKVFIILKYVNKTFLYPVTNHLTTYLIKNIVFWLVETNPQDAFTKENMLQLVIKGLKIILDSISSNRLRYYMVPDVNLFGDNIAWGQRHELIKILDELLLCGPRLIMKCPRFAQAITKMTPMQLIEYGRARDQLEMLELYREQNIAMSRPSSLTFASSEKQTKVKTTRREEQLKRVCFRMNDIVWPDWRNYADNDMESDEVRELLDIKIHEALT